MPGTPSPAHTAGKLTIDTNEGAIVDDAGRRLPLCGVDLEGSTGRYVRHEAYENARRLVALWNACSAIPTASLEAGVVEGLLKACLLVKAYGSHGTTDEGESVSYYLELAIAQATGQG